MLDDGPFITVWAASPSPEQLNAGVPRAVSLRSATTDDPAFEAVLDELAAAIDAAFPAAEGLVAVADRSSVRLVEPLPNRPRAELVRVGWLPSLSPVFEHRQTLVAFAVVITDRHGADLYWSAEDESTTVVTVPEADGPITKVAVGGWSQRRFQQRAENTWEHTAHDVADALVALAQTTRPRTILLGGDLRMAHLVRDRLPADLAALVREISGGRSADGSQSHRDAQVGRWVATAVAEDTVEVLRTFERERGQHDRAADGVAQTLAALRESRVDVLCIHDDPADLRTAWFVGDDATLVATGPDELHALGAASPRDARLVDVAARAAIGSGAAIRIIPASSPVSDGIGAILRW